MGWVYNIKEEFDDGLKEVKMDVKEKIEEIVKKIKGDPGLTKDFQSNPEKTIESLIGVDIPDGVLDQVISGVKAALTGHKASGIVDKITGIFKK